jgi:hypothetical protein
MAFDALASSALPNTAFTDVAVLARDTCEEPFQSESNCCFFADFLHIENPPN